MYASIDKNNLELIIKTIAPQIERDSVIILKKTGTSWSFAQFTVMELQLLYRNLGFISGTSNNRASLEQSISKLLDMKPARDYQPEDMEELKEEPVKEDIQQEVSLKGEKTATIWNVADKMWEQVGSPKDLKEVLKLRRKIMDELEQNYSIKKTTSSTALGGWQKARVG